MATFAKINKNNVVEQVIVVSDSDIGNLEFPASEAVGQEYIKNIGLPGTWIQTSYTRKFRKNFAGIGYTYDSKLDAFISPSPYPSWIFDEIFYGYRPPVAPPTDAINYRWNEKDKTWVKI
jgi:hypothetical protein